MSDRKTLQDVIDSGMCVGCGACVAADPSLSLRFDDLRQTWQPDGPGSEAAAEVCPAIQVDFPALHAAVFPGAEVTQFGVVHRVMLAQSVDRDRNLRASSGGLIKELLQHYIEEEHVDGVIALDHIQGTLFEPALLQTPEEVDALPGSIYHINPLDKALKILAENEGRFVVVGIPCQLEGMLSYIHRQAPHLAPRIHATVGLLCGWLYNHHALRAVCRYKGVDYDAIEDVAYRGGGPVGKLRIQTPAKSVAVSRRVDFAYQVAFDRSFNIPRCHTCVNHSNYLADIVVGDAWLPSTVFTKTGISLLIIRKAAAADVVDRLAARGRIVGSTVSVQEIEESQKRRVVFGDFAYAYLDHLRAVGEHAPDMVGPNRPAARLRPRAEAETFHKELQRKRALQNQRKYRTLWLRKATLELPRLLHRYLDWFLVRILRVKSYAEERKELEKDKTAMFK